MTGTRQGQDKEKTEDKTETRWAEGTALRGIKKFSGWWRK